MPPYTTFFIKNPLYGSSLTTIPREGSQEDSGRPQWRRTSSSAGGTPQKRNGSSERCSTASLSSTEDGALCVAVHPVADSGAASDSNSNSTYRSASSSIAALDACSQDLYLEPSLEQELAAGPQSAACSFSIPFTAPALSASDGSQSPLAAAGKSSSAHQAGGRSTGAAALPATALDGPLAGISSARLASSSSARQPGSPPAGARTHATAPEASCSSPYNAAKQGARAAAAPSVAALVADDASTSSSAAIGSATSQASGPQRERRLLQLQPLQPPSAAAPLPSAAATAKGALSAAAADVPVPVETSAPQQIQLDFPPHSGAQSAARDVESGLPSGASGNGGFGSGGGDATCGVTLPYSAVGCGLPPLSASYLSSFTNDAVGQRAWDGLCLALFTWDIASGIAMVAYLFACRCALA